MRRSSAHNQPLSERVNSIPDSESMNPSTRSSAKQPLLYVDVNLGPGKTERIIVYDGDTAESLAEKFAVTHGLDLNMKGKLA
jgi:hypothetical protein